MRRRRLTEAEWEAELQRAKEVMAADVERHTITWPPVPGATAYNLYCGPPGNPGKPMVVRTPPKRSRWGRPWDRRAR